MDFSHRSDNLGGIGVRVLSARDGDRSASLAVAPEYGANLCRWMVDGRAVIDFEPPVLAARGYTGTPVLYPTPSCVRGGAFTYKGREFRCFSPHRPAYEHGLVHDRPWQCDEPRVGGAGVSVRLWIDFAPGTPQYEAFPFRHTLSLRYTLAIDGVTAEWSVENREDEEIPFGFALHPYFIKLSGDEGTMVRVPAESFMEATADLLPTGRLLGVAGRPCDIRAPRPIGSLHLDHVFTDLEPGAPAVIYHRTLRLAVRLAAGKSHTHIVFYSPAGERYFCVENQTCSTDAHNMFARGFEKESGLKTVPPMGSFGDSIRYGIVRDCGDEIWD